MPDKEVSQNTLSDNASVTDADEGALEKSSINNKTDNIKSDASTTATKNSPVKTPAPSEKIKNKAQAAIKADKPPTNKTATIALIIASVSVLGSIGHYLWQKQQADAQLLMLSQQNQQAIQQGQAQLKSSLTSAFNREMEMQAQQQSQQLNKATSLSQQNAKQALLNSENQIKQLTTQVNKLEQQVSQRDPSDWLIHEAEYLVRVAARTMWLEQDTKAAISLLRDADSRLKELNQPKFLPVRALINEDIEALALMPTLETQEAILTLMALNNQIPSLTLASVSLAEAIDAPKEDFSLSEDINDWKENLAKTWQKFINDFITVRRRSGMVEPLMSPVQQQNLKENLSLKVQLVKWAASEHKEEIYQQALLDIQQWLNEFFDMNLASNKNFYNAIEQLKAKTIYYNYPSDLRSLTAIKRLLEETKQGSPANHTKKTPLAESDSSPQKPKNEKKTEPEKESLKQAAPITEEKVNGGQA